HSTLEDVGQTLREAYHWLRQGCEIGMYPYVIPFSGAALSKDPGLLAHTHYAHRHVAGTNVTWEQPVKILPIDPVVTDAILRIERSFEEVLAQLEITVAHLPSRVRSLLWILSAVPIMAECGQYIAEEREVRADLYARLPAIRPGAAQLTAATA
ncbi:MAG TPA: hypothetical protein VKG05_15550, partial [Steroidobacteraceae bacterium]|nr:hypothetical protein [Steroidobacteraceae bacterium]